MKRRETEIISEEMRKRCGCGESRPEFLKDGKCIKPARSKVKVKKYTDGLYTWAAEYPHVFFAPYPTKDAKFVPNADMIYRGLI